MRTGRYQISPLCAASSSRRRPSGLGVGGARAVVDRGHVELAVARVAGLADGGAHILRFAAHVGQVGGTLHS